MVLMGGWSLLMEILVLMKERTLLISVFSSVYLD